MSSRGSSEGIGAGSGLTRRLAVLSISHEALFFHGSLVDGQLAPLPWPKVYHRVHSERRFPFEGRSSTQLDRGLLMLKGSLSQPHLRP